MHQIKWFKCVVIAMYLCVMSSFATYAQSVPFSFVAMGDMPYGTGEGVQTRYRELIQTINQYHPDFSIHVGDFKSGAGECTDAEFKKQLDNFDLFSQPLIYTPGDNDWTDCHRVTNGSYDPVERLAVLRTLFFSSPYSLGKQPLRLERQSSLSSDFSTFTENQRWVKHQVLFVTLHIVGSNNNFDMRDPDSESVKEFNVRDAANIAWIQSAFDFAAINKMQAIVFAMQADVFESKSLVTPFPPRSGFRTSIGDALLPLAQESTIPVLLIHGDSHVYKFDQPFTLDDKKINQLTRLEVPGDSDMRAVLVTVDPTSSPPFKPTLLGKSAVQN